jgi:hypothetical protein
LRHEIMTHDDLDMDRRSFLRAGLAGGAFAVAPLFGARSPARADRVALVVDPADAVAAAKAPQWALGELEEALGRAGASVRTIARLSQARDGERCVVASGMRAAVARDALARAQAAVPDVPEALAIVNARIGGRDALVAAGADARGLVFALLELADRVRSGQTPAAALDQSIPIVERPSNTVRSVMRQFTSEALDRAWFDTHDMWPAYLTMLATQRFNRLHLAFGLGYDALQQVADSYLLFLYPFLVRVPGYDVRVTNVTDADRERNLDMLRYISEQTVARGLEFQLGVWMHGYELVNSPRARHIVEGLTPATHAAYCRDALTTVLRACPAISSVGLRIHGESGIAEGSYDFWRTVFDGVPRAGRTIEIDLHAKGIDATMIEHARATGMPVNVSPKYWAEHLGMPYHQTAIRDLEMPVAGQVGRGLMTLSEGSRSFTRYGYADLLRDDRQYTVRHRVFAGTQRLLMSGDAETTTAYARMFSFCGSTGVDLMEPLTCRGRRGTGIAGTRRSGYADPGLEPRWDWEKYEYWYRVWGRLTYDADADAAQWRRAFDRNATGNAIVAALASASRILPIVTTAHLPSAACDAYWPEIYWNQPIVGEPRPNPYGDTPAPKTFTHVSPLDPQIFSSIHEHAAELLSGDASGKYSPVEVAQWIEDLARETTRQIAPIERASAPDVRRIAIDARIQAGLGLFFAAKLRAGVLYAIHEATSDRRALDEAVAAYRRARQAWADLSEIARAVYAADLSVSDKISERGQWIDRLPAIDEDIARMAARTDAPPAASDARAAGAIARALGTPNRGPAPCAHVAPSGFRPGAPVSLEVRVTSATPATIWCCYRHVNQAERFERVQMDASADGTHHATIPAAYTDSPYPLQYYFVVKTSADAAHLYPSLGPDRLQQPYIVLRRM